MPPPIAAAAEFRIAYRPMTDGDLPFVAALYASTREQELAAFGWPEEMRRAFLDQQHRAQHQHYRGHYPGAEWLIVERGGEPIGRLYLDEGPEEIRLVDVSLLPGCRGSGLGGAILRDLQAQARNAGKALTLHVDPANPAIRLYARLGFQQASEAGAYLRMEWRAPEPPADQGLYP